MQSEKSLHKQGAENEYVQGVNLWSFLCGVDFQRISGFEPVSDTIFRGKSPLELRCLGISNGKWLVELGVAPTPARRILLLVAPGKFSSRVGVNNSDFFWSFFRS